jgi:hypothetical protein
MGPPVAQKIKVLGPMVKLKKPVSSMPACR